MYVFTQKISSELEPTLTLPLTAAERTRSRYRYRMAHGITDDEICLELPRGTTLRDGDCLGDGGHTEVLKIVAKPEPVLTVRAAVASEPALQLLRAAYHLGNRHVALEVGTDYLRLTPDPVLESMLHQLGVTVVAETQPFQPESGAYGHHH
ncbi:urease accessory protein UreE [Leptothoe sp. PORK10 BA2]|uniref:urease accessory protein UreE n=1 Tax=Leptothoe sp. PORK10 BA2 TaxID=3110254 RepID=UPI002B206F96|nr:urease accessory protein UreE [Leptothoe sp. PORK10 BA2]MEA5466809.1 urease accessory protein UreE [Leptothoe sp. PORK10 BA2]